MSQTAREAESKEEKKLKAVVKPIDMAKGFSEAKALFKDSFSAPPWSDDWSDEAKLNAYIDDIAGQRNSCTLGLCAEEDGKAKLVGLSLAGSSISTRALSTGSTSFAFAPLSKAKDMDRSSLRR